MGSHLFDIDETEEPVIYIPPPNLSIPVPDPNWYKEGIDLIAHERPVRLTRGMHLLNEWWREQKISISYPISSQGPYLLYGLEDLEIEIRRLHHLIAPHQKNADRTLVFGIGATQIIHASLYALAVAHSIKENPPMNGKTKLSPLWATQQEPGYIEYGSLIEMMHYGLIKWIRFKHHKQIDPSHLLEFITTPNNPDGRILQKKTKAFWTIHDRVNHWPLFLNLDDSCIYSDTLEEDMISIFSLSKFLSFSGSRIGYAFVKDPEIARYMRHYILMSTHGLVSDAQQHALEALKYLLDEKLFEYITWVKGRLNERWDLLKKACHKSPLKLLNFQGPTAWLLAPEKADKYLLEIYHSEATYGTEYGSSAKHIRLNMLSQTNEFMEFIWRLEHKYT